MKHIATVQLQDYYQHKVFETVITKRHWSRFESRLRRNVDETLKLFNRYSVNATFFALGWIADRFPDIIRTIQLEKHEIACAGFWGADRSSVTQLEFREDMKLGKESLEAVTGARIDGYRSIRRSFTDKELWLIDLVAEEGFQYDSSLLPIGWKVQKKVNTRFPFIHETRSGLIHELPHATRPFLGYRIPIGGGNYLRQLPAWITFGSFKDWIQKNDAPFVMYFHPWELDSDIPNVSAFDTLTHIRQYRNLGKLRNLLPRYFEEANFGTAREYLQLKCRVVENKSNVVFESKKNESVIKKTSSNEQPISIVIPCYNEEATISFLSRALEEVSNVSAGIFRPHYYLVDDKSTDDTVKYLKEMFSDNDCYTILELSENRGVSGAIHAGIKAAKTEIVCSIDADCSYDPVELLQMIPLLDDGTSLVTASPYHRDGAVLGVPSWRLFLSKGLSGIYRFFLNHKLSTYTSCFRVYRKSTVIKYTPQFGDFRGIVELLAKMDIAGESIKEYPTTLQSRIFGFSKMKTLKTIRDHIRLLFIINRYKKVHKKELKASSKQ